MVMKALSGMVGNKKDTAMLLLTITNCCKMVATLYFMCAALLATQNPLQSDWLLISTSDLISGLIRRNIKNYYQGSTVKQVPGLFKKGNIGIANMHKSTGDKIGILDGWTS